MTKNARIILDIINSSSKHLSADDIYFLAKKINPKIVLATIYNNLNSLVNNNEIKKISMPFGPDLYDKIKRHDHLVCIKCGKISDLNLEDLSSFFINKTNLSIISYDLKLNYICEDCQKN